MKKTEYVVVGAVLLVLFVLEVGARMFEERLSKDVAHIRSLPLEAARLREAPDTMLKVLILGNSLARCGLDRSVLSRRMEMQVGRPVEIAVMHPDGSRVEEWHYGYRRYFDQARAKPDLVLLCTGRLHLVDGLDDLDSVAAFYTSWHDLPGFMHRENLGAGAICQATVARLSVLFAHRRRVQPLVFYNFMPRYEPTVNLLGRTRVRPGQSDVQGQMMSCENFASLADTVHDSGSHLVMLQVPLPEGYELPPAVVEMALKKDVPWVKADLLMPRERYHDGYHMDAAGAAKWTNWLLDSQLWQAVVADVSAQRKVPQRE